MDRVALRQGHVVRVAAARGPAGRGAGRPAEPRAPRHALGRRGRRWSWTARGGRLAFATLRAERHWPDELVPRLRLLADVFASALARQRAERAVRESEERFRRMADSAPVMVWLSGPDGRRTYVNQRWLDFTGRRLDEELGESWMDSVHPDDRTELGRGPCRPRSRSGRPFTIEYRLRAPGRRVSLAARPRRAAAGRRRRPRRVRRLGGRRHPAPDRPAGPPRDRSPPERHLRLAATATSRRSTSDGRIIAVNQAWLRFAAENGADPARVSIGANYLDVCRDAADAGDPDARRILEAVRTVLAGGTPPAGRVRLPAPRPASAGTR